jgi:hypothetical protein
MKPSQIGMAGMPHTIAPSMTTAAAIAHENESSPLIRGHANRVSIPMTNRKSQFGNEAPSR